MDPIIYPIILIIILIILYLIFNKNLENMVNIPPLKSKKLTWSNGQDCFLMVPQILSEFLKNNNITKSGNNSWNIYIPCSYNNIQDKLLQINPTDPNQRIFAVNNSYELTNKALLWQNLVRKYGRARAQTMAPTTYVLANPADIQLFKLEYKPNLIYILKKNIQRQEGLKITKNYSEILSGFSQGYVVVQKLLQDPYLINNRKINQRFYVLLVCQNNQVSAYIHQEGFMYYTKVPYKINTLEFEPNITTGYIDRSVYETNPLTLGDFRIYLKNHGINPDIIFNRIYGLIKNIILSMVDKICVGGKLSKNITFQLFGFDIALDKNLNPMVMEANLGPSIDSHDQRDGEIKRAVITDIFKILKIIPNTNNNGYIQIIY